MDDYRLNHDIGANMISLDVVFIYANTTYIYY